MFDQSPFAIYWSVRNTKKPENVPIKSNTIYEFDCTRCNHSFKKRLCDINAEICPYCVEKRKKMCDNDDCNYCFNTSFARNPFSRNWSDRNLPIRPRDISWGCDKPPFYFNCDGCGHELYRTADSLRLRGCTYCSNQIRCYSDDCVNCYNHSFRSNPRSIMWCPSNKVELKTIAMFANIKYKFCCNFCDHKFKAKPSSLSRVSIKGSGCPHCSIYSKKMCSKKNCEWCNIKSFA
jgi:hypothetical protein